MNKRKKVLQVSGIVAIVVIAILAIIAVIQKDNITKLFSVKGELEQADVDYIDTTESERQNEHNQTVSTTNWNMERVNIVYDTENVPVPVPKGYVASGVKDPNGNYLERTIDTGFVIYEGTDPVEGTYTISADGQTATMDEAVKQAQTTRNQWVWVPIYNVDEIYGTDANGKKWGKLYNFDSTGRYADNWKITSGTFKLTNTGSDREPDVVRSHDNDKTLTKYLSGYTREELYSEMTEMFENNIESIKKYGGFYIGRYEAAKTDRGAKVVKGSTADEIGSQSWYEMYYKTQKMHGTNNNVTTSMIWGSLWDATLEWMVDTGNKTYEQVGTNSTSWGNYRNAGFNYINTNGTVSTKVNNSGLMAGCSEYTKSNNIYDMAGNMWEWTLEACSINARIYRGGGYDYRGNVSTAGHRNIKNSHYSYTDMRYAHSTLCKAVSLVSDKIIHVG